VALDVLILRDPRESAKKCSLTTLRGLPGIRFVGFAKGRRLDARGRVLLHPGGEELGPEDRGRGLLLLDCAWRRLPELLASVDGNPVRRRLPALATAYPRKSLLFADPDRGLASIEALYAALALLGEPRRELLDGYLWAERFLAANPALPRDPREPRQPEAG
jgi:pre-rRNA-processing protein TSR3